MLVKGELSYQNDDMTVRRVLWVVMS